MSDNVPFDAQETPWTMNFDNDLDQWTDPGLPDFSIPDDFDWSDSMEVFDWSADQPDALGSCNAGPISGVNTSRICADRPVFLFPHHVDHEQSMKLGGCLATESEVKVDSTASNKCSYPLEDTNASVLQPFQITPQSTDVTATSSPYGNEVANFCHERNCKHKRAFKSPYELARHTKTVHGGKRAKRFICDAQGCFGKQQPWSFARADKLTSHIKAAHNHNTVFGGCPIATCSFGPCTLEVLGVHILHAHEGLEEGRSVCNATPCKVRKCPLLGCGKYVVSSKTLEHIKEHSLDDIRAEVANLELDGFHIDLTSHNGVSIQVVCPVCHTLTTNATQFAEHLVTDHLYAPSSGGHVHFEQWKSYWNENIHKDRQDLVIKNLLPWSYIDRFATLPLKRDFQCPGCSFSTKDVGGYHRTYSQPDQRQKRAHIQEHHLSFLRPEVEVVAELRPHRFAILRLWPEFVTHPVFADFDRIPQQSTAVLAETQYSYVGQQPDDVEIPQRPADNPKVLA